MMRATRKTYSERDMALYSAQVYLREARARRHQVAFHATLLQWAANTRRRIVAMKPAQGSLFPTHQARERG